MGLEIRPISFRDASAFVERLHRHNKPPRGCKFCVGAWFDDALVGVAQCGRPVARAFDDGRTLEINRTCTDGTRNANSILYGASRGVAKAMGYRRVITYTQADESGASLKASGFVLVKKLEPRGNWAQSSGAAWNERAGRSAEVSKGGVERVLWEIRFA
jgi:hypothetical protein